MPIMFLATLFRAAMGNIPLCWVMMIGWNFLRMVRIKIEMFISIRTAEIEIILRMVIKKA